MSRTGNKPIKVPDKVKVRQEASMVFVEGPKGKLEQSISGPINVAIETGQIKVSRNDDSPSSRALHGLTRSLIANMVHGVSSGFQKELDIKGVGYRAEVKGKNLNLSLGFSHPVVFPVPEGIAISVDKQTHLVVSGHDKVQVGQVAADIRKLRPPEPYKGKGIQYTDETIIRKAGKSAAGSK